MRKSLPNKINYKTLTKDVLTIIKPPFWNSCYYINTLLRKAYEKKIPDFLEEGKKYHILDYGCGVKPYEYIFSGHINKYIGVDVVENPKADYQLKLHEKLPFKNDEFDIIISSQVLEHVENIDIYMKETYRVLKKGGVLLLSTHGTWQYHASPYDYQRWTSIGIKRLVESYNIKVVDFVPILGQLAVTSQLRLNFYDSFANITGIIGKILLFPISIFYQIKMKIEDIITPERVKFRDSAIYLIIGRKL